MQANEFHQIKFIRLANLSDQNLYIEQKQERDPQKVGPVDKGCREGPGA